MFSFGMLLHECLGRSMPYMGVSAAEIAIGVITGLLDRPSLSALAVSSAPSPLLAFWLALQG